MEVLEKCREYGITLSPDKVMFAQKEINFVGYKLGWNGINANPEKVSAFQNFPRPKNVQELRSFIGMVNQMGHFTTELAKAQGVLKDLIQKKNVFVWNESHDKAFEKVKEVLTRLQTLILFDPNLDTKIEKDGSNTRGLGYTPKQLHGKGCQCKCTQQVWKSIQCWSRYISTGLGQQYWPRNYYLSWVAWNWVINLRFIHPQKAAELNFFHPVSRNP